LVENEIGKKFKCPKLDNGGEYLSKEFDNYCSEYAVLKEKTITETP